MNYQSRTRAKTKRTQKVIGVLGAVFIVAFITNIFAPGLFTAFAGFLFAQDGVVGSIRATTQDTQSLLQENQQLKQKLQDTSAAEKLAQANQRAYLDLYQQTVGTTDDIVHAAVLSRPPFAAYDTYVLSQGSDAGIHKDSVVIAQGQYVIGYIDQVAQTASRARLFSSSDQKLTVDIDGFLFEATGAGGGILTVRLPRNFADTSGQIVRIPSVPQYALGLISTTEFDPQDSYVEGVINLGVNVYQQDLVAVSASAWVDVAAQELEFFNTTDNEAVTEDTDTE